MFGRASVLAVYLASVYFDIWSMINLSSHEQLLGIGFIVAFISADTPWFTYSKTVEVKETK